VVLFNFGAANMSDLSVPRADRPIPGYREGWSAGLALGAVVIAATAFINLLSVEKSLVAVVLALLSLRAGGAVVGRARWALGIAAAHIVLVAAVLILFHDKLLQLLHLLQSLG
jgi:hypothetical protein